MKISKIHIENFRLLKNASVSLEDDLSLVVGKNNTGKTSLFFLLRKFLETESFEYDDFNLEYRKNLEGFVNKKLEAEKYPAFRLSMLLEVQCCESDSLKNVSDLMLDLSPDNNKLLLLFEYSLGYEDYCRLVNDFNVFKTDFPEQTLSYYLDKNHKKYFKVHRKSIDVQNNNVFLDIEKKQLRKIISYRYIPAKRDVSNLDGKTERALSQFSSEYHRVRAEADDDNAKNLQRTLIETDKNLSEAYKSRFKDLLENIKKFSDDEADLNIESRLKDLDLLRDNTYVKYTQDKLDLPESYNGLGYMNLFAILFDIHIKLDDFKKINSLTEDPADINLLFIEEPEAHTHPQLQYVFIKNIKEMLSSEAEDINLQTLITTHSSHIVAEVVSQSDFDDIKYFHRASNFEIEVKNLKDLKKQYDEADKNRFKFLKQYLTLNHSELFFADKVIFVEGATEKILFPAMIKKTSLELLSQNVSIIEVGNYSHIFAEFLDFLRIKTLIVTDIDSVEKVKKDGKKGAKWQACPVKDSEGKKTSNPSIKYYLEEEELDKLLSLTSDKKNLSRTKGKYKADIEGHIRIAYQVRENDYNARSFEDAFLSLNLSFIVSHKDDFLSLKCKDELTDNNTDYFYLANKCIDKKASFATDILYYSTDKSDSWQVPLYIKEGLEWLATPLNK